MPLLSDAVQSKVISRKTIGAASNGSPSQHYYLREGEAPAEPQRMNRQCTGFLGAMSKRLRIPNNRFDSEERYGVS